MYKCVLIKKAEWPHIKTVFAFFDKVVFGHQPPSENLNQQDEDLGPNMQTEADAIMAAIDAITEELDVSGSEFPTPISSSNYAQPTSIPESTSSHNFAQSASNIAPHSHRSPSPEDPQPSMTTVSGRIETASVCIQLDVTAAPLALTSGALVKARPLPKPRKKAATKAQREAATIAVLDEAVRPRTTRRGMK